MKIFGSRPRTTTATERPTVDLHARGREADNFDSGLCVYQIRAHFCNIAPMMPSKRPKALNEDAAKKIHGEAQVAIQQGELPLARRKNAQVLAICPESIAAQNMKKYIDCFFDMFDDLVEGMRDGSF